MVRLDKPQIIRVTGKGNKLRIIPLLEQQVEILKNYMQENGLNLPQTGVYPLFYNNRKEKLTRAGVAHILMIPLIVYHPFRSKVYHLFRSKAYHFFSSEICHL